jgi:chorismate mutase
MRKAVVRGVRGAITVDRDTSDSVLDATRILLNAILAENQGLVVSDIAAAIFTVTQDISSAFPALAARQMGWTQVPMMCSQEIPVPGSLPFCIRVLLLWNTSRGQNEIKHIYLREALSLRPDIGSQISEISEKE